MSFRVFSFSISLPRLDPRVMSILGLFSTLIKYVLSQISRSLLLFLTLWLARRHPVCRYESRSTQKVWIWPRYTT
jgi:hypothetical protein